MKTYRIIGRTNPYIAQRDITFGGKTKVVIQSGLTLKEAQKMILGYFNEDYDTYYKNWGLVRCNSDFAYSHSDGTRGYEYDSRYFEIEEEEEIVEPSVFRAEDSNGNTIYIGSSKMEAADSIYATDEPENYKLYGDELVIWDGDINSINELVLLRIEDL